jgi:light-harvesting protein B-800-850 alpha chain
MNNGRIWCVVNPTVGLPAFLGSVALISFTVHFAVLNNTTWVADFFKGSSKQTASSTYEAPAAPMAHMKGDGAATFLISVAPNAGATDGASPFVITVTPGGGGASQLASSPGGIAVAATEQR